MQPSRRKCLWASAAALVFLWPAARAQAGTVTITSTPSGATVEIDGVVVGKTPYRTNFPNGYFHKTRTAFGTRLEHAMILRVSLEGYGDQNVNMTEGPFAWRSLTGRYEGTFFLLRSDKFEVNLAAARGPVRSAAEETMGRIGPMAPAPANLEGAPEPDAADTGSILVTSETEGAEIYADGHFVGQTPSTIRLTTGAHRIEVRAAGHEPWVRNLDVLKSSRVTLRAAFGGTGNDEGKN